MGIHRLLADIQLLANFITAFTSKEYKAPAALAIYLRLANRNNIVLFRNLVKDYLARTWIVSDELFENIETVYPDEVFIDLKINAGFRTLDPVKDKSLDPWHLEALWRPHDPATPDRYPPRRKYAGTD